MDKLIQWLLACAKPYAEMATYVYDAWGNCTITKNTNGLGTLNPFRYRGYYWDSNLGLYYLISRYYDPQTGRFINSDTLDYLDPETLGGLNLYAYCGNNPVNYKQRLVSSGRSNGGSSISSGSSNEIYSSGYISPRTVGGNKVNWANTNSVAMTHYTTSLIKNEFIGSFFGNISYTVTTQLNDSEMFYSYSNVGNGGYSTGVGMNLGNWYGISAYVSSNFGFGTGIQLTPWITFGAELSLKEGISFSVGKISGNITQEITANVGWGTIAGAYIACAGVAAMPIPGAKVLASVAACFIFLIDIFN